jgi:small-conductance mechanosensitive channel
MKNQITFTKHFFTVGAMSALLFWTAASPVSLAQTIDSQSQDFSAVEVVAAQEPTAADLPQFTASTEDDMLAPAAAGTNSKMRPSTREVNVEETATTSTASAKEAAKAGKKEKMSLPAKVLMKTAVKKIEKAHKRMDIKAEKAAKKGKAIDQQVKIGIIIALIGLLLIIIGGALAASGGGGVLAGLGGLALVVGLVIILLAALEVI